MSGFSKPALYVLAAAGGVVTCQFSLRTMRSILLFPGRFVGLSLQLA